MTSKALGIGDTSTKGAQMYQDWPCNINAKSYPPTDPLELQAECPIFFSLALFHSSGKLCFQAL